MYGFIRKSKHLLLKCHVYFCKQTAPAQKLINYNVIQHLHNL